MKLLKRMSFMAMAFVMCASVFSLAGCKGTVKIVGGVTSSNKVTILTTAAVGTATTDNDPYKKYIQDNYGLDVTLIAASDFSTTAQLKFSNIDDMPDIVAFESIDSFRTIYNQGVLLSDWSPYLE